MGFVPTRIPNKGYDSEQPYHMERFVLFLKQAIIVTIVCDNSVFNLHFTHLKKGVLCQNDSKIMNTFEMVWK